MDRVHAFRGAVGALDKGSLSHAEAASALRVQQADLAPLAAALRGGWGRTARSTGGSASARSGGRPRTSARACGRYISSTTRFTIKYFPNGKVPRADPASLDEKILDGTDVFTGEAGTLVISISRAPSRLGRPRC
jgi:hypothetical protein